MAKQLSKKTEAAAAPFQFALSTKAGCGVSLTSSRNCQIVVLGPPSCPSIGLELSRKAMMLESLLRMEDGDSLLCEMSLREPIHIFVGGRDGRHPNISQGEGGEQGDPPHALAVRIGAAWFPRCNSRKVERQ